MLIINNLKHQYQGIIESEMVSSYFLLYLINQYD